MATYAEMVAAHADVKSVVAVKIRKKKNLNNPIVWNEGGGPYIYIGDYSNNRIHERLKSDLTLVSHITLPGTGSPYDVCTDGKHLYITRHGTNGRIEKYLIGSYAAPVATAPNGTGDGQVKRPNHICTDGTYIYVTDGTNHRVQKLLCSDLSFVAKLGGLASGTGNGQFNAPTGICVDVNHVYVGDTSNHRIQKLTKALAYVSKVGSSGSGNNQFSFPLGLDNDGIHLYIADSANYRIQKRRCDDLSYVMKQGSNGTGNDQYAAPYDVVCDKVFCWIPDATTNHRVKKINCSDLAYVAKVGSFGAGDNQFNSPRGIGSYTLDVGTYNTTDLDEKPDTVEEYDVGEYTEVGSVVECAATPGSWYWDASTGTFYIHGTGGADPSTLMLMATFEERIATDEVVIAGEPYQGLLQSANIPDVVTEISGLHVGGVVQSFGAITINNDGHYDEDLADYIYEAAEVDVFIYGDWRGELSDVETLWTGWTGRVEWTDLQVTIGIEDLRRTIPDA